jgi:ABC-type sugar transport system permease subunit
MKQAIYIFSLYIGAVAFFTLYCFGQAAEISLMISSFVALITVACIRVANRGDDRTESARY